MVTILFFIAGGVIVFHGAWYLLSLLLVRKALPSKEVFRETCKKFNAAFHLDIDESLIEEEYIIVDDIRIHMDIMAHAEKRTTIVFIPGTSIYARIYIEVLIALYKEGFNVITFDPRGHGQSGGLRGDYSVDEIVDEALAVVAYARERFSGKIAVMGSSQGGIAAFYAAARDDTLDAAVCHNIADLNGYDNQVLSQLRVPYRSTPLVYAVLNIYRRFTMPVALYLNLKHEIMKDGRTVAEYLKADPFCVRWITLRAMRSLLRTDLAKPVEQIRVPVMVIHSDDDHIFPQAYIETLFGRLRCEKEYVLFKNTGHLVIINKVAEVTPRISAWLKKIAG